MLAVIPLVTCALVLTAFDNLFPSFFSVITALWVLTDNIDFSSWSRHGVHQENNYIPYYNKLSYIRTLPAPIPTLLVIAGLICVVLAIIGRISGKIEIIVPPKRQRLLGGVGIVFLVSGLVLGTIIQPTLIDEGIKPTSTPPITSTTTPSPTPTPTHIIDTMDSTSGWETYIDNGTESSINITSVSGRTGNAIEISYDLKEGGYVAIIKEINPEILSNKEGIRFFYKGSGRPNTLALVLVYSDPNWTSFGVSWDRATVKDDWVSIEVPYTYFDCWHPKDNCLHYGNKLDLENVRSISFAISNNITMGDVYGSGEVIIDDVHGIPS